MSVKFYRYGDPGFCKNQRKVEPLPFVANWMDAKYGAELARRAGMSFAMENGTFSKPDIEWGQRVENILRKMFTEHPETIEEYAQLMADDD